MGVNKDRENFLVKITSAEIMNSICEMFRTFCNSQGLANVNGGFVVNADDDWGLDDDGPQDCDDHQDMSNTPLLAGVVEL